MGDIIRKVLGVLSLRRRGSVAVAVVLGALSLVPAASAGTILTLNGGAVSATWDSSTSGVALRVSPGSGCTFWGDGLPDESLCGSFWNFVPGPSNYSIEQLMADNPGDDCYGSHVEATCKSVTAVTVIGSPITDLVSVSSHYDTSNSVDLRLGAGDDEATVAGLGERELDGGGGEDTFVVGFLQNGSYPDQINEQWTVDLAAGTATAEGVNGTPTASDPIELTNFENINAYRYARAGVAHELYGDGEANEILGRYGSGKIDGRGGDDYIYSEGGPAGGGHEIRGGAGADVIYCGFNDYVIDASGLDELHNCETDGELEVTLETEGVDDDDDLFEVKLKIANNTGKDVVDLAPTGPSGLDFPIGVIEPEDEGKIALFSDSGEPLPTAMPNGDTFERSFTFLTLETGRVLIRAEMTGKDSETDETVRDAEYADVEIEAEEGEAARKFRQMGAMEAVATHAHNQVVDSSADWGRQRADRMIEELPPQARKKYLGAKGKLKVRPIEAALAEEHGMSPEEMATQLPDSNVVKKGGEKKIDRAEKRVRQASSGSQKREARANLRQVKAKQTLTPEESYRLYAIARQEADKNETYLIYEDYAETPAKALYNGGGAMFEWMLQGGTYEGRQQIEADLVRFADSNEQNFDEAMWVWSNPDEAYDLSIDQFSDNAEDAALRRSNRETLKRSLYMSDPEQAIRLAAEDDSYYGALVLRGFIELFAPEPGINYLDNVVVFGGKKATTKASQASVVALKANQEGNEIVGRKLFHGAEDLGDGARHADAFTFASADPDELLSLDQLGRRGGAGIKDQRIAEQINRDVSDQLRREFPDSDVEFNMYYRPKKSYDPVGSLSKPQAFQEKSLAPRAIEVLGAPASGLGRMVIFKPKHPSQFPGWKKLPAIQKQADLEMYEQYLGDWVNFNKRVPSGKTKKWKPALDKRTTIEFGGDHSVTLKLEKKQLGKDAFEIRATEMRVDGTKIYKGKKAVSIGGDLDPLAAINATTGKKLTGEIERRALELWNEKAVKAQKDLGFRSGGHGATAHGDDVTPQQWSKFAKYAAVHMSPAEQLKFERLVVARAGLPPGTKILPAGLPVNEHLLRTSLSDTWTGPLGDILD